MQFCNHYAHGFGKDCQLMATNVVYVAKFNALPNPESIILLTY